MDIPNILSWCGLAFAVAGAISLKRNIKIKSVFAVGILFAVLHVAFAIYTASMVHTAVLNSNSFASLGWIPVIRLNILAAFLLVAIPSFLEEFWAIFAIVMIVGTVQQFLAGIGIACLIRYLLGKMKGYKDSQPVDCRDCEHAPKIK